MVLGATRSKFVSVLTTISIVLAFAALKAEGAGFQNPPQGTAAAAQGGAFTAQADDITAITHNPAGLTQISGTSVLFTPAFVYPSTEYSGPGGVTAKTKGELAILPNLYFATDLNKANWRFGLGITTPFGQGTDWTDESPFPFSDIKAEMKFIDVNPTIAYQINPRFSIGLGLNYYNSDIELESPVEPGLVQKIAVAGEGYGYNLGFLYKPSEKHSIGGAFRSGFSIKHTGSFSLPVMLFSTPSSVKMNFPNMASIGYAYRPNKKWKIEADLEWIQWSSLENLTVNLTDPLPSPPLPPLQEITQEQDWEDTFSPRIGIEFRPNAHWKLQAGYVYLPTSIPDRTFNPSLPDANAHIFCFGFGWNNEKFALALSQELSFPENRKIEEGGPFDGTYKSFNMITALNIQYNF